MQQGVLERTSKSERGGLQSSGETPVISQGGPTLNGNVNCGSCHLNDAFRPVITLEYPGFSCSVRACKADYHVEDLAFAFQEDSFTRGVLNNAQKLDLSVEDTLNRKTGD